MTETLSSSKAVHHLLVEAGSLQKGEKVLIVVDEQTESIGVDFFKQALAQGSFPTLMMIPLSNNHGEEPPPETASLMSEVHLIVNLTSFSKAHTHARIRAAEKGARFLSLPEYSKDVLLNPAVMVDYKAQEKYVRLFSEAFSKGSSVHVTTAKGTNLLLDIRGRTGNYCPGFVTMEHRLGSPPDIEANVSPVETASTGEIVVDGSIACPQIGLLRTPMILEIAQGRIQSFQSEDKKLVSTIQNIFEKVNSSKAYILAECGVGLNPLATLTGSMLTDEGALGCVHFGFGSNATVGGINDVPFHLDFVVREASLAIDGKAYLEQGQIVL